MGYSHYYYRIRATPQLAADTRAILAAAARLGIEVRGPDGTGHPQATARRIALNGDAASGENVGALQLDADGDPLDHWFTNSLPDPEEILARNHRAAPALRKQTEQEDPEPAP